MCIEITIKLGALKFRRQSLILFYKCVAGALITRGRVFENLCTFL